MFCRHVRRADQCDVSTQSMKFDWLLRVSLFMSVWLRVWLRVRPFRPDAGSVHQTRCQTRCQTPDHFCKETHMKTQERQIETIFDINGHCASHFLLFNACVSTGCKSVSVKKSMAETLSCTDKQTKLERLRQNLKQLRWYSLLRRLTNSREANDETGTYLVGRGCNRLWS